MNKAFWWVLIFAVPFLKTNKVHASHSAGADLYYEWVSDSTYKLIVKFYRDCTGVVVGDRVRVCYTNDCDYYRNTVLLNIVDPVGKEVFPGCPGYQTKCKDLNSPMPGFEQYTYEGYVTLPSKCKKWTFYLNEISRSINIGNLVNANFYIPPNWPMYLAATLNNEIGEGNNSPKFSTDPVPYVCVNKPYTYNNGGYDPDGDQLRYEHVQPSYGLFVYPMDFCIFGNPVPIRYCCGYAMPDNPFSTNFTYRLNPVTGHISFTPNAVMNATLALKVTEYRNGVEVGSVMRDMMWVIQPCNSTDIYSEIDTPTMQGAIVVKDKVEGCEDTPMEVCLIFKNTSDPGAEITVQDNHHLTIPGATVTYTRLHSDSVRACLRWTPGLNDTGLKVVVFMMKDSACRGFGANVSSAFTLPVYINPQTKAWKDTALCPGDSVRLNVSGWRDFTWSAATGGSGASSLSCTSCLNPWVKPLVTTRYFATSNNKVCRKHTDTVTITVLPSPDLSVTPDTVTCSGNSIQLDAGVNRQPGSSYRFEWSPAGTLSNTSIEKPVASPNHSTKYYVTVTGSEHGCKSTDSVFVAVIGGFQLHNPDTAICTGDQVRVRVTADSRYTFSWNPAQGVSDPHIANPVITPDSSRRYTLTASYPGCRDTTASFQIEVQPIPSVILPNDTLVCKGYQFELRPIISPASYTGYSYHWNPSSALTPDGTIVNPLFTATAPTNIGLTVQTSAGCQGNDQMMVNVAGIVTLHADTGICPGDTIQLFVQGDQLAQIWRPGVWISDTLSATPYVYPSKTTTYTVYTLDSMSCNDTQSVTVVVHPKGFISLPDSAIIYDGETFYMAPGGNCLYFEWFPESAFSNHLAANPMIEPGREGWHYVQGRTINGCPASDSVYVRLREAYVDFPNAFVPGSGPNGTLKPVYRGGVLLKHFHVFNRWGEKVFETKDITEGWDGKLRGRDQPLGVYVYTIEAVTPSGKVFYKQGNVSLLR